MRLVFEQLPPRVWQQNFAKPSYNSYLPEIMVFRVLSQKKNTIYITVLLQHKSNIFLSYGT